MSGEKYILAVNIDDITNQCYIIIGQKVTIIEDIKLYYFLRVVSAQNNFWMMSMKWYKKTWVAVLFLFVFAPAGIFLIWMYNKSLPVKVTLTIVGVIIFMIQLPAYFSELPEHMDLDESESQFIAQMNGSFEDLPIENPIIQSSSELGPDITLTKDESAAVTNMSSQTPLSTVAHTTVAITSSKEEVATKRTTNTANSTKVAHTTIKNKEATSAASKAISGNTSYVYKRNENATISITGSPGVEYSIRVIYPSGAQSKAKGLENKVADTKGNASWTWHIGGKTNPGKGTATVSGGNESFKISFEIIVD